MNISFMIASLQVEKYNAKSNKTITISTKTRCVKLTPSTSLHHQPFTCWSTFTNTLWLSPISLRVAQIFSFLHLFQLTVVLNSAV